VRPGSLLQFGVSPYRGRPATLQDGTLVRRGDRILHLHLDNRLVVGQSRPWALIERARKDLDDIAEDVASGRLGSVRAIRGVSVLAPAAAGAGFEVRPLPRNRRWALIRFVSALVIASYHRAGIEELDRGLPWPSEVWMSAAALRTRLKPAPLPTGSPSDVEVESRR
jgi:YkoP-like protein